MLREDNFQWVERSIPSSAEGQVLVRSLSLSFDEFKAWRDRMSATPRRADYVWTTLARVLSVARDHGRISTNPCEPGGPLYTAGRQDNVWTEADISRVLAVAKPEMELALMLALWTGQRQGDLLSLPWSAYDDTHVRLRQRPGARSQFGAAGP
jgi:integrase